MDEIVGFEEFKFNCTTGELLRHGARTALAPTPAKLLKELVARPGEVITRERLWAVIWPEEHLDLDQRLNYCVHQLRQSLGDSANDPRIVQTLPRLGYRFLPRASVCSEVWTSILESNDVSVIQVASRTGWPRVRKTIALCVASVLTTVVVHVRNESPAMPSMSPARHPYALAQFVLSSPAPNWDQAEAYLQEALTVDSTFAPAYVALATIRQELNGWSEAERFLNEALRFDPELAEAHQMLGVRRLFTDWDWNAAEAHLNVALKDKETRPVAHRLLAHLAVIRGDRAAAVRNADSARSLSPAHALSQADAGWVYYWAGNYSDAVAGCQQSVKLVGHNTWNEACLLSAFVAKGDVMLAAQMAQAKLTAAGFDVSALADRPQLVLREFYQWRMSQLGSLPGNSYALARLEALIGRPVEAMSYLSRAAQERHVGVLYAASDPVFDILSDNKTFKALCEWVRSSNRSDWARGANTAG